MKSIFTQRISKKIISLFCFGIFTASAGYAQTNGTIDLGSEVYTQNFNSPGVNLPTGFTIDKYGGSSGSTTFDAATVDGVNPTISSSMGRGAYKYGNTDYAIGFMTSGAFGPNLYKNIKATIRNETGGVITQLDIAFIYKKYRSGNRAFSFKFYANGTERTAGSHYYPSDGTNNNVISSPHDPQSKTVTVTGLNILPGQNYELKWVYESDGLTNGQGLALDDVSITPTVLSCDPPSTQASMVSFDNIDDAGAEIAWTNGSGDRRLVFIKETSSVTDALEITDGTAPVSITADANYGMGSEQGDGWYCVFNGTAGSSMIVSGLSSLTDYRVQVIEMNDCDGGYKYNNSVTTDNPANFQTLQSGEIELTNSDVSIVCNTEYVAGEIEFISDLSGIFIVELSDASGSFATAQEIGTGTESPVNITIPDALPTGTGYQIRIINNDGGDFVSTNTLSLIVTENPAISTHPAGVIVCASEDVTLTVESDGTAFQWYKGETLIDGATAASYTLTAASVTDAGIYSVEVSNGTTCTVMSDDAEITINANPVITTHPVDVTACIGEDVILSVESDETAFQWYKGETLIDGATAANYTLPAASVADAGIYSVAVSNGTACTVTSEDAEVIVNPFAIAAVTRDVNIGEHLALVTYDYTEACEIITTINNSGTSLGNVTASVNILDGAGTIGEEGDMYIGRVYNVDVEHQPSEPIEVKLYYTTAEIEAYNAVVSIDRQITVNESTSHLENLNISVFHGTDVPGAGSEQILIPHNLFFNGNYWEVSILVDSFSQFLAHGGSAPLPIELVYFTGINKDFSNILSWQTALEDGGEIIQIERSQNGNDFEKIAEMQSKGSAGIYSHIDDNPFTGDNFYRLYISKQNGVRLFSNIIKVNVIDQPFKMTLFPNPVNHNLYVKIDGGKKVPAQLSIIDISGKIVLTESINSNEANLDVSNLSEGTYILQCNSSFSQQNIKFVVEK